MSDSTVQPQDESDEFVGAKGMLGLIRLRGLSQGNGFLSEASEQPP